MSRLVCRQSTDGSRQPNRKSLGDQGTVRFRVLRFDPDQGLDPRLQELELPVTPGMTVLDGLLYIQKKLDPSLAFRASCRAAVCGSCAMLINGEYGLACETPVQTDSILVAPLPGLRIHQDLVVDLTPFWEKLEAVRPYLMPGKPSPERELSQSPDEHRQIARAIDCILCGCCTASCMVTHAHPEALGPAALQVAYRFVVDSRDGATEERLLLVGGERGVLHCHNLFHCQLACPKELNPTQAIARLKLQVRELDRQAAQAEEIVDLDGWNEPFARTMRKR